MMIKCHVCDGTGEYQIECGCHDPLCGGATVRCERCHGRRVTPATCDRCTADATHVILDHSWHRVDPKFGIEPDQLACRRCVYDLLKTALDYEPTSYARALPECQAEASMLGTVVADAIRALRLLTPQTLHC